jgi:hypothetical protein
MYAYLQLDMSNSIRFYHPSFLIAAILSGAACFICFATNVLDGVRIQGRPMDNPQKVAAAVFGKINCKLKY